MRNVVETVLTCEDECVREYTGVNVYLQLHAVHARICYNVVKTCLYVYVLYMYIAYVTAYCVSCVVYMVYYV